MSDTQARFRTSPDTSEIDKAMAKAQADIGHARPDKTNPHFKSRFASLKAITDACRPALTKNGIATLQAATSDGETVTVTTRLSFQGQFYEADLSSKQGQPGPQALGSVVSYLKRYGLAGLCGVPVSEDPEDDDGEATETRPAKPNGHAAAEQIRAAANDPASRKAACFARLARLGQEGKDLRAFVGHAIGRTVPGDGEIKLTSVQELEALESATEKAQAAHDAAEVLAKAARGKENV